MGAYLEWCSRQNKTMARAVELSKSLGQFTLCVLHAVSFVNNHVCPLQARQSRLLSDYILIRR